MVDRLAPSVRPRGAAAGTQQWRRLLFAHATVDPALLRPLVPAGLELDLFEGQAYVGLVPFAMERVRPWWLPRQAGLDFLETNVRTYVLRHGEPGVWFFSLEAASRLAVLTARATFGLPYFHAHMQLSQAAGEVHYRSVRRGAQEASTALRYRVGAPLGPSEPGSLPHFLLERYLLFVERSGAMFRGQVHHPPYPVHAAELLELADGLVRAAGLPAMTLATVAALHFSPGVDVEVFPLQKV